MLKFLPILTFGLCEILYNAEGFIKCNPSTIISPTSITQIQEIVKDAYQERISVKAVGAGHSTNSIICSKDGGIALKMESLNSIVSHDKDKLQVTVQGGAGLVKFMKDLIPLGMSVEGLVDYGAITVAGSIATGAHSSSLKLASGVADHVIACKLVDGTGKVVTLNRADRDFDLVHTNLGAIGILVEVTFQAVPLFKVETKQIDLSNQLETLPDDIIGLVKKFDYANLYWFTENNGAILHTYNKVAPETPGNGVRNTWNPSFSSIVPWGYYKVIELLNNVFSENEMCLLAGTRVSALKKPETNDSVGYLGDMYMGTVCEGPKCLFPQVDDVEIAIPLDKVPQALRDIKAITAATKVCFPVFGLYVRFGLQSKTLLGPTSDGDKAFIEIHILRTRNGTPHLGFSAVDEIRQLLLIKYDGKPHYGKNFAVDFIGRSSKEFDSKIKRFDPRGIFSNKFLESRNQAQELSPGCAFERTCVCKADDHCYPGWVCTSGSVYKDASVCKKGKGVKCIRDDECASNKCQLFRCTGTS